MWIPQWLLKSLHKVCIIITYTPWCGIRPAGCLAQGLVWAIEHCVRGARIPPTGRGKPAGVGFPIVKYRQSAPSRVLFDGKFHQAVAGWTVNLSGFIQICLSLSHVVVGPKKGFFVFSYRRVRLAAGRAQTAEWTCWHRRRSRNFRPTAFRHCP